MEKELTEREIEELVKKFDDIPGLYRDNDDYDETVTYYHEGYMEDGVGVEVFFHESIMDLFLSFEYTDISSKDIIEQNTYAIEDLEMNEYKYWCENYFILFLKEKGDYFVCEWDDGAYMCPGHTSRIGYRHIPCDDNIKDVIERFIKLCDEFMKKVGRWKETTLLSKLTADFINRLGYHNTLPIKLENGKIEIIKSKVPINELTILQNPFIGATYALFELPVDSETTQIISLLAKDAKIFSSLVDNFEYSDNVTYFLVGSKFIGLSRHFMWISSYDKEPMSSYAKEIEKTRIMEHLQTFLPYADDGLRNIYFKDYRSRLAIGHGIRIFTEGATDWRHLKYHWLRIKDEAKWKWNELEINYHEYEPLNSTQRSQFKMDMGGNALCDMCASVSQMKNDEILVFIADRDRSDVVKKMSDDDKCFKYWGNNVYSIILPVPPHRKTTPQICIEHYYTDSEIKTEFKCADGVIRRLYIGNEFDEYGRAVAINRFCINRDACGNNSIRIIGGSTKERVLSMSENSDLNYALGKMQFAEHVCNNKLQIERNTTEAFEMLLEIIRSIKIHNNEINMQK
ncbi:hypothetical protein [Lacrimispora sp.]|uniref:hypothetical protein n=1 Tax=Lacrimispora sp. TaxID=2719234 RepID=UPI00289C52D7|nr:hypothetical protein [Lacrimispora sp.]